MSLFFGDHFEIKRKVLTIGAIEKEIDIEMFTMWRGIF